MELAQALIKLPRNLSCHTTIYQYKIEDHQGRARSNAILTIVIVSISILTTRARASSSILYLLVVVRVSPNRKAVLPQKSTIKGILNTIL